MIHPIVRAVECRKGLSKLHRFKVQSKKFSDKKRDSPDMSRPMPMMLSLASADRAIVDSLQALRKKIEEPF